MPCFLPCQLTDDNFVFSNFSTNSLQRSLQRVLCPAKKPSQIPLCASLHLNSRSFQPSVRSIIPQKIRAPQGSNQRLAPNGRLPLNCPERLTQFFIERLPHSATSPAWQLNSAAQPQSRPARLFFSSFSSANLSSALACGFHVPFHGAGIQRAARLGLLIKSSVACAHEPCIDGQRRSFARRLDGRL